MRPLPWQERALALPEEVNIFLGGGRGGGKSAFEQLVALGDEVLYGERSKVLFVRPDTYKGGQDFEDKMQALYEQVFPRRISFNRNDHMLRIAGGGSVEFSALDAEAVKKFQGREFSLIVSDETGNFTTLKYLDKIRGNLRMPGRKCRMVISANPGGPSHAELNRRYVTGRTPWRVFTDAEGTVWIYLPSTYHDNPNIDAEAYRREMKKAAAGDDALYSAWETGDWNAIAGAFFTKMLSSRLWLPANDNEHEAWCRILHDNARDWSTGVAIDWGMSAPSVALLGAIAEVHTEGPDGRPFQAGSKIVLDELHTAAGDDPMVGSEVPAKDLARMVGERCDEWCVERRGVIDDARGLDGSTLIDDFRDAADFELARPLKDRVSGWRTLRGMMVATKRNDPDQPGIWISQRCRYLAETLPNLLRSALSPEDIQQKPKQPDHGADALRYFACWEPPVDQGAGGGIIVVPFARNAAG